MDIMYIKQYQGLSVLEKSGGKSSTLCSRERLAKIRYTEKISFGDIYRKVRVIAVKATREK